MVIQILILEYGIKVWSSHVARVCYIPLAHATVMSVVWDWECFAHVVYTATHTVFIINF